MEIKKIYNGIFMNLQMVDVNGNRPSISANFFDRIWHAYWEKEGSGDRAYAFMIDLLFDNYDLNDWLEEDQSNWGLLFSWTIVAAYAQTNFEMEPALKTLSRFVPENIQNMTLAILNEVLLLNPGDKPDEDVNQSN